MSKETLLVQGQRAMHEIKFQEAIRIFDAVLAQDPANLLAMYLKGQALSNLGNEAGAISIFDQALSIAGRNTDEFADILIDKGISLLELNKLDAAEECFEEALGIKPRCARIWVHKARSAARRKQYQDSVEYCDRAISMDPQDYRAWHNKAFGHFQLNQLDKSIECDERAVSLNPGYVQAWLFLAAACERKGKNRRAQECLSRAQGLGSQVYEETRGQSSPVAVNMPTKDQRKRWQFWK